MVDLVAIIGLIIVIGLQIFDRWQFADREEREKEKLLDELSKANAALVAKSGQDYAMMRSIDTVRKEEKPAGPEGVDVSELNDEDYDKMLAQQLK